MWLAFVVLQRMRIMRAARRARAARVIAASIAAIDRSVVLVPQLAVVHAAINSVCSPCSVSLASIACTMRSWILLLPVFMELFAPARRLKHYFFRIMFDPLLQIVKIIVMEMFVW